MPQKSNVCIVCSNFIAPYDRRPTAEGPVHRGECLKQYEEEEHAGKKA